MLCSSSRASLWKQYFKLTDHATNDWFTDSLNEWMSFIYIKWFVDKIVVYLVLHVGKNTFFLTSTGHSSTTVNTLLKRVDQHASHFVSLCQSACHVAANHGHASCSLLLLHAAVAIAADADSATVRCWRLWPLAWFAVSQWKCRIVFAATPALFWNRSFPITIYTYTACTLDTTS